MRMLIAAAAAMLAGGCDEVTVSAKAPGYEAEARMLRVVTPTGPLNVRTVAIKDPQWLAEAMGALKDRCGTLERLDQLSGDPVPDALIYQASCDTGQFQLSIVDGLIYVKPWTGTLVG